MNVADVGYGHEADLDRALWLAQWSRTAEPPVAHVASVSAKPGLRVEQLPPSLRAATDAATAAQAAAVACTMAASGVHSPANCARTGLYDDRAAATLTESLAMVQESVGEMREGLRESVTELHNAVAALDARVAANTVDMATLRTQLAGGQEQMRARLEETIGSVVEFQHAINACRSGVRDAQRDFEGAILECRTGLRESKRDLEQCQAQVSSISTAPGNAAPIMEIAQEMCNLQQEFTDFQKHMANVLNRSESDARRLDDVTKRGGQRIDSLEAQVQGIHNALQQTVNDVTLIKKDDMAFMTNVPVAGTSSEHAERRLENAAINSVSNATVGAMFGATPIGSTLMTAPLLARRVNGAQPLSAFPVYEP